MANKNYVRGRNAEYEVMDKLRKRGCYVVRSAGSKGGADIIATNKDNIFLIQVKKKKRHAISDEDVAALEIIPAPPCAIREIWHRSPYEKEFKIERV